MNIGDDGGSIADHMAGRSQTTITIETDDTRDSSRRQRFAEELIWWFTYFGVLGGLYVVIRWAGWGSLFALAVVLIFAWEDSR